MSTDSIFRGMPQDLQFICDICDHNPENSFVFGSYCKDNPDMYKMAKSINDCKKFSLGPIESNS